MFKWEDWSELNQHLLLLEKLCICTHTQEYLQSFQYILFFDQILPSGGTVEAVLVLFLNFD